MGALWELSGSSLGALWELSGSSLGARRSCGYEDCPNTLNNISVDWHYFKVYMDPDQSICYVYRLVRQVKRCICIKMLYATSGDIFYLCLILLNRKACSDKDVLTYIPVCGGGKPIVCTSYHQSAIAHAYVDSIADVRMTYDDMCTNGTGAQCRSYFVVLSLHGYAMHVILDDYNKSHFMFWITSRTKV
jgi:hypothetical protein